ncbi:MAG: flgB [Rickettsiaceae bacterium]|jgi:flagellar basal-body rod protein FlgB|nr:flgB [Rickettsiaceae bacterium]
MKILAAIVLLLSSVSSATANDDVFSSLQTKMRYLNSRQSVISQNIANANTPGYKSNDLKPLKFGKSTNQLQLATTTPGHIGGAGSAMGFKAIKQRDSYETTPTGNNVVLEEQMVKMSETDRDYETTTNVLKQMNGLLRTAIGGVR